MPDGSRADQSAIVVGVGARQGVGGALGVRVDNAKQSYSPHHG